MFKSLALAMSDAPEHLFQTMAEVMLDTLWCDSAGFSVLAKHGKRFHWPAIAGAWRPQIGRDTPRDFSPCGDVLDRNAPLLFSHCERRYEYLREVVPPIEECLMAPFRVQGRAVGTIWAISHGSRRFDEEDLRLLKSLAACASAAYQVTEAINASAEQRLAALSLMEDAIRDREEATRLAALVESSNDAIVSSDLDGIITTWNRGAQRLFGQARREAVGRPLEDLIAPQRREQESEMLELVRRGRRIDQYETTCLRKDGTQIDVCVTVSPIREGSAPPIGMSFVARDISESRRTAGALREADRHKDEFLAMLGHELRNPLAPILLSLEILRRTSDEASGEEGRDISRNALDVVQRQVGQMVRLVDDLLDAGRISRGKIALRKERTELAPVVRQALEAVRPLAETRNQQLTVALPATPFFLDADPARLAQIIGNLLNNGCKFTPPGGHIWLAADVEEVDGGSARVAIRVRDDGIGISKDQLTRIFEMFAQVDTSLERSLPGLGIGLSLVKTLVVMHEGTVEAHSAGIGRGSEFVVRLPAARPAAAVETARDAGLWPHRLRVLVVDDNRDAANALETLLHLAGHEVHLAHDGVAALDEVRRTNPEVIMLDIGLPGMNGYEVARKVREMQGPARHVVLVALTGWGQEEDRRRSAEAGFDAHAVKPIGEFALARLLAELRCAPRDVADGDA